MKYPLNKHRVSAGYLFCPRCGLRKPKSEILGFYSGYCPYCGARMIVEGSLPYVRKSNLKNKSTNNTVMKENNIRERNDLIYGHTYQQQSDKHKKLISKVTEAIRIKHDDINLYFLRATLKVRSGDIEGASKDFRMCEKYHQLLTEQSSEYPLV